MAKPKQNDFTPEKDAPIGFESVYTGDPNLAEKDNSDPDLLLENIKQKGITINSWINSKIQR